MNSVTLFQTLFWTIANLLKSDVNYPYFGNDLHDLETIVMIWKPMGMYLKIIRKRGENTLSKPQNQLTLRPQIDTLKTW